VSAYIGGVLKFLLVVIVLAIAVYLTVRVIQRRGLPRGGQQQTPPRPQGPDDDDEFLRELDRRKRHPRDPDV